MTKLLTGAAAAALLAGAANAQVVLQQGDHVAVANTSGTPVAGDNWFATEIGDIAGITVPLEFSVFPTTAGAFPTAPNVEVLIQVDVTNAVLDRSLVDGDVVASTGSVTCNSADMTVDSNGAAGDSTVTFRIADIAECSAIDGAPGSIDDTAEQINFALPLILSGGDVDVSVSITRASNGSAIASGAWSSDAGNRTFGSNTAGDPLITQASAVSFASTAGVATAASALTYTTFADNTLGAYAIDTTGVLLANRTPVADGDVFDADLFCTFADVSGLNGTGHALGGATNGATAASSNPVPFNVPIAEFDGAANTLTLASTGGTAIQPQSVSCSGDVQFTTASGLSDYTIPSFDMGIIRREGPTTGFFEWVGDASLSTGNVFRITGLGATSPTASVIVNNSSTGMDGEYPLTLPTPTNGEVILNNAMLTNQIGAFGRADLQFSFHDATLDNSAGAGLVVRRFMVGANGTLFDMGNDNDDTTNTRVGIIPPQDNVGGGSN
ncbi:MAG: hypothetical protein U9P68_13630 [Pseudomonadota bacterium]|nr:hypothetical protein [Pseudomonadota bacterium]